MTPTELICGPGREGRCISSEDDKASSIGARKAEVGGEGAPVNLGVRQVEHRPAVHDAGIVDEDADGPAYVFCEARCEVLDGWAGRDVGLVGLVWAACARDGRA